MKKHYIVCRESNLIRLLDSVNNCLADGFQLAGGLATEIYTDSDTTYYLQALVREEE